MKPKYVISIVSLLLLLYLILDYYNQKEIVRKQEPIVCLVLDKHCKAFNRDTSYCLIKYNDREYYVGISKCELVNIGIDDRNFYYEKSTNQIFMKGNSNPKMIFIALFIIIVLIFFIWFGDN